MAQGLYNNTTVSSPGNDTQHIVEVDKLQVNLFFDGTLNNYYNVKQADRATRDRYGGEGTSYENALSNVARLWEPMGKEVDGPDLGVYVQGMGTTKFEKDSLIGYAFGDGETGIRQRAQEAFEPLKILVKNKRRDDGLPAILELNVFGFSRGAATARHFVHLLRNKEERSRQFSGIWNHVIIQVNFVGLFDTVSSEGVYYGNDVDDLGLRFVDDSAFRVFHLVALDEYRENFSDTTIESARTADSTFHGIRAAMGFELGIPGAHSDVGGGYTTDFERPFTEERKLPPARTLNRGDGQPTDLPGPQEFVYAQGWYTPNDQHPARWAPWLHKRQVTGDYYKVALSLMVDMAERFTIAQYSTKVDMTAREAAIAPLQASLRAYLEANAFKPARPSRMNWELNTELGTDAAKAIRHKHLHLSFNLDATGMGPRYKNINTLERHHEPG